MSLSTSENDWELATPLAAAEQETPADLQDELFRIHSKAVEELDLSWKAPDEPSKSKLDMWFLQSSRRQATSKRGTPFFPDVHEHVVKSWAAPQSARTLTSTQAMFAPVDEAGDHGYLRIPPVEETVATHLCPSRALSPSAFYEGTCSCVVNVVNVVSCSIKQNTSSQPELFSPLAPHTVLPALPSSSAESRSINIKAPRGC
ncbi:hypothetical protein PO909_028411 [Leuciscus waleckii]